MQFFYKLLDRLSSYQVFVHSISFNQTTGNNVEDKTPINYVYYLSNIISNSSETLRQFDRFNFYIYSCKPSMYYLNLKVN